MNLPLHVDCDASVRRAGTRPVLVLLHGFAGDGTTWEPVRAGLRRIGPTVAVDLIGHGQSPTPEDVSRYDFSRCLDELEAVMRGLRIENAWWVGYSMGGRVALTLALEKPHLVRGLVLESAGAGIASPAEREARVQADEKRAQSLLTDGVEAFMEDWLSQPMFHSLWRMPEDRFNAEVQRRERQSAIGLANALRGLGQGAMPSLWDRLADLQVPALIVAGEEDERYSEIGTRVAMALPGAQLVRILEAGHAIHTEQPEAFLRAVTRFLFQQERQALAGLE